MKTLNGIYHQYFFDSQPTLYDLVCVIDADGWPKSKREIRQQGVRIDDGSLVGVGLCKKYPIINDPDYLIPNNIRILTRSCKSAILVKY